MDSHHAKINCPSDQTVCLPTLYYKKKWSRMRHMHMGCAHVCLCHKISQGNREAAQLVFTAKGSQSHVSLTQFFDDSLSCSSTLSLSASLCTDQRLSPLFSFAVHLFSILALICSSHPCYNLILYVRFGMRSAHPSPIQGKRFDIAD